MLLKTLPRISSSITCYVSITVFLFSVTGNIKLILTLILKDPWRVAFTWSKSAFMARRKWSDGLRRAGQGNPAAAKCCKIYPPSHPITVNSIGLFVWFPQRGCYITQRHWWGGRHKKIKLYIITNPETQQRKRERNLWDSAAAAAHLPCGWSFTKINKPSTREKGQIVEELKNLTAWLMNGGNNSASIPC